MYVCMYVNILFSMYVSMYVGRYVMCVCMQDMYASNVRVYCACMRVCMYACGVMCV